MSSTNAEYRRFNFMFLAPKISVVRPDDLLALEFEFSNLGRIAGWKVLKRIANDKPAYLIVHFPPQHILEQAFYEKENWTIDKVEEQYIRKDPDDLHPPQGDDDLKIPVGARLSGSSRLVFQMPDDVSELSYTLEGLLEACSTWTLNVAPQARFYLRGSGSSPPESPDNNQTAIELPYHLIISPHQAAAWRHAKQPVTHNGRTELWHTRLDSGPFKTIRAIWSKDSDYEHDQHTFNPFRASLTARDRWMLVQAMANYSWDGWVPKPAMLKQLMLSSLGGWLNAEGAWLKNRAVLDNKGIELLGWKHQTSMGRDQYVRVIYSGFLFPFGHAASLIKVTERKFETMENGRDRIAVLRQRYYIVVTEALRMFPQPNQPFSGREFPFRQVRILTEITPNLADPGANDDLNDIRKSFTPNASGQALFWPIANGDKPNYYKFDLVATDLEGKELDFKAPLIFVSKENGLPFDESKVLKLIQYGYENSGQYGSQSSFNQQLVCYADSKKSGDTDFLTETIHFSADAVVGNPSTGLLAFLPKVLQAKVSIPALQTILGNNTSSWFQYNQSVYKKDGFSAVKNKGQVFFDSQGEAIKVSFSGKNNNADKSGGIITPDFTVSGISRSIGTFGGNASDVAIGRFNPQQAFPGAITARSTDSIAGEGAKFLGGLLLNEILDIANAKSEELNGEKPAIPKIVTERNGDTITTQMIWTVDTFNKDHKIFEPVENKTQLTLENKIITSLSSPDKVKTRSYAKLTYFSLKLFEIVKVNFDELEFESVNGSKPDVNVDLSTPPVQFLGALRFVDELRRFIPSKGFSDPPDLEITPNGLTAGYTLGLPPIAVGIFSLENIKLSAFFTLPFNGDSAVFRFNFCERHDTFILTVSGLGGGGFLAIAVTTNGIRQIEAALEFGGRLTLNVGVASGAVYIKAGIYFSWKQVEDGQEEIDLVAYYEAGGMLSVLGLITISTLFYLALIWQAESGVLQGQATVIVDIDLTLFSKSVSITVERTLHGSNADPQFKDLYLKDDWEKYCEAFAADKEYIA